MWRIGVTLAIGLLAVFSLGAAPSGVHAARHVAHLAYSHSALHRPVRVNRVSATLEQRLQHTFALRAGRTNDVVALRPVGRRVPLHPGRSPPS